MTARRAVLAALAGAAVLAGWAGCSRERRAPTVQTTSLEKVQTRSREEWLREEPVRLLYDYIRIDTTNPAKGEKEGAEFLKAFFDCAGIQNEIVCPAPGRCNVLARLPGKSRRGALLLLNHIDVVDAYGPFWSEAQPFEGTIKLGYMYGRGTYDMKSIAIAQALAMRRLKERGIVPESDVLFLGEADEEVGQEWGSRWLLDHRPEWFEGVANVLNEGGTNEMVLRDVRYWGIETIQSGYALAELEAPTPPPLEALASKFAQVDGPVVAPHPDVVTGFDLMANHLSSPLTDPLRHLDRVRRDHSELASLPDRYAAFLEARIYWQHPYPYPPEKPTVSRAYVVISVPPGLDPRTYLKPILDGVRPPVRVVRTGYGGPSGASPYPTEFTRLLERVVWAYSPGVAFGPMPTFGGYTTSVLFRQKGFATYGFSPIAMNVMDSSRRHGNDERIFLRDYLVGCAMYADILEEFATKPPIAEMSPAPTKTDNK
jgi:acetylornithine deacetylase/succinyl-diaminopimelate desuccinylase-like protein